MIDKYIFASLFACLTIFIACDKLVEIPESKNQIESTIVFADSSLATSALLGVYFTLGTQSASAHLRMKNMSLYADEYLYTSSGTIQFQFNQGRLSVDNTDNSGLWSTLYSAIYQCNALIEGVDQSSAISISAKKMLKAEAKFLRAFSNFYLVNFYGNVPLILTSNVAQNSKAYQSSSQLVYDQIINDLLAAKSDLPLNYIGVGKVRANSWVASALLARVYLYQSKWHDAEQEATRVINSALYSPLPKLEDVFLANSEETILQFWSANGFLTDVAQLIPASATVLPNYSITTGLYQAFEGMDGRKSKWISTNVVSGTPYNFPSKYKNRIANTSKPEYVMGLRLSEQYLIRAEALVQQDNVPDAIADLNVIRARATGLLPLVKTLSKEEGIIAVTKERRLELFGEWGHRFLDLKRKGEIDAVIGALKPLWKPASKNFPIPISEITYNSNLIQNDDY